ncbi:MAG: GNAT family N-acetyltransferase [Betaproteobacteria bacterium]|nr:GNAT family N-acetyltransferase [Betaproteobacteria bacterium]
MTPTLSIRPATRADIPAVLGFIRELADYEKLSHLVVATEASLERELFGPGSPAEVLLGEAAGEPVAFAVVFHNFSTFLGRKGMYLEDLYVKQSRRRQGYGRALLLHIARLALERGCGRFEWSVLDWNAPAIRFYEKLGASILHEWKLVRVTGPALARLAEMG